MFNTSGSFVREFPTVWEPAYNRQYATPVAARSSQLLIPTWERGLFCYSLADGQLQWRQTPCKVRQVLICDTTVVCEMADRGIYVRDLSSGELTGKLTMSGIEIMVRLDSDLALVGPKRSDYVIVSLPTLDTLQVLPSRSANPDRCLSFCPLDAHIESGFVVMTGWEEYPDGDYTREGRRDFRRCFAMVEMLLKSVDIYKSTRRRGLI